MFDWELPSCPSLRKEKNKKENHGDIYGTDGGERPIGIFTSSAELYAGVFVASMETCG